MIVQEALAINSEENSQDIGEWLASVSSDPVRFVMEGFEWGRGELAKSQGPEEWQLWALQQIKEGLTIPGRPVRLAVSSGHGIGKSTVAAWVTLWAMCTAADTRGTITASSEAMLYTRLRAELRVWFRRFKAAEYFEMSATALTSKDPEHTQTWRIDLQPWSETRPETFAGLHNKGRRILLVFDESSAIAEPVWQTCEAVATDADAEVVWLALGNPLHPQGHFKDIFDKYQDTWKTRHVSSLDVSFTNKAEFARWARDYGEDSDFYRTRVLGEFPKVGSDQFISPAAVDAAMSRELDPSHSDPLVLGIDVARFGSDSSVLFARKGRDCRSIPPLIFKGISLDRLEDHVVSFCNQHPVQEIFVDGGGVGGGLVDHLRRRNYLVHDVQFGSRADQMIDGVKYANKRAEIWGLMRNALKYLCLPNSPTLKEELCAPEYTFSRTSDAIQLESKDMLRKRLQASPDQADALAVTFGAEVATLPALSDWVEKPGVTFEYNPFDDEHMRPDEGKPFVDQQSGYTFRLKRWDHDGFNAQDFADAAASDALRIWQEPKDDWGGS
jgi:hypothetical protein